MTSDSQDRERLRRHGTGGGLLPLACVLLLLGAGSAGPSSRAGDQEEPYPEYQVKAAFLYHFTRYVEWPPEVFASPGSSLILGVVGADPFRGAVDEVIKDRSVAGRPLVWRRFDEPPRSGDCHVLYVGFSDTARLKQALGRLRTAPILTVGDGEAFGDAGGIVWFRVEDKKVRFVVNLDAARRAGLKISSRLLGVATVVGDQDVRGEPE